MKDIRKLLGTGLVVVLAAISYFKFGPNPHPAPTGNAAGLEQSTSEAPSATQPAAAPAGKMVRGPDGLTDLGPTLERIRKGIRHPHRNDGSVFQNRERLLPTKPRGYYREYVHPTPGVGGPGPQRVVIGEGGEIYHTPDHYQSFVEVQK